MSVCRKKIVKIVVCAMGVAGKQLRVREGGRIPEMVFLCIYILANLNLLKLFTTDVKISFHLHIVHITTILTSFYYGKRS